MKPSCLVIVLALSSLAAPSRAQVLETSEGPVEFVGLERWTPERVRDTLAVLAPGEPLTSSACAVVLQEDAGFAQASVTTFIGMSGGPDEEYVVIRLVEPGNADRVRYLDAPPDSLGPIERWKEAYEIVQKRAVWHGAIYQQLDSSPEARPDTGSAVDFLRNHATKEDYRLALEVLHRDRDMWNRAIAATIMAGFPERDAAWHALVRTIRGHGALDAGRSEAAVVLSMFSQRRARPVDWAPAAEDLRAVLDGTNLFGFDPVLGALVATEPSPELADELLGNGGSLVLAHLGARLPYLRHKAHRLLVQISGQDFGEDTEAWRAWIATL